MEKIINFSYIDETEKIHEIPLIGEELSAYKSAKENYEMSKKYVDTYYINIWRYQLKMYHMSTEDRRFNLGLERWRSNITLGLSRSFVDMFKSTLTERPIVFSLTAYDDEAIENKDNILNALSTSADATGFQDEVREIMGDGLKVGQFTVEIGMYSDKVDYSGYIFEGDDIVEVNYKSKVSGFPYAKRVSVFDLFPDVSSSNMRYTTRRNIMAYSEFYESYALLIESGDNKSPFKDMVKYLGINKNGADFQDRKSLVNQIYQKINEELGASDPFSQSVNNVQVNRSSVTHDMDDAFNKGLMEVLYCCRKDKIVIIANNYPIYIGVNPFGFIPFESRSTIDKDQSLGCEGIGYIIKGIEQTADSHMNNYIDGVRVVANPSFLVAKGMLVDQTKLKNLGSGAVIEYDPIGGNQRPVERLDKGGVTDFNVYNILVGIAQRLLGASEYNMGGSTKERTATGALAATQSSQKRLSPFLASFVSTVASIAEKWLALMRIYWTDGMTVSVIGTEYTLSDIQVSALKGNVGITLQMDSMFSAINEFQYKKLIEVYAQTRATGLINEDEVVREIFRSQGLSPDRFVPAQAPQVTSPDLAGQSATSIPGEEAPMEMTPDQEMGQNIASMSTPSVDLGNGGEGAM